MRNQGTSTLLSAAATMLLLASCGRGAVATGPSASESPQASAGAGTTALASVTPRPDSPAVSVDTQIVMRFSHGMGPGMERLVYLHEGDINGPVLPASCGWSGDRTTLTCTPASPLRPHTQYTVHMGGGMVDGDGKLLDWDDMPMAGLHPLMAGMMSGPMSSMMGPGWQAANGTYGMFLSFTTAG